MSGTIDKMLSGVCKWCGGLVSMKTEALMRSVGEDRGRGRMTEQQIVGTLATKVMGWQKYEVELDLTDGGTQKFFDSWRLNGREVAYESWNPLKNIADAWQVVEQIEKDGFDVQIYRGQGFTSVEIIEPSQGMIIGEYEGGTTQESICHAALRVFAADLSHR